MSRKIRSGESVLMALTASRPLRHSSRISICGSFSSSTRRLRRASGSSSTISVLIFSGHYDEGPQRHHDHYFNASAVAITNIKLVIVVVELLQTRGGVCQTDAGAAFQLPVVRQPAPLSYTVKRKWPSSTAELIPTTPESALRPMPCRSAFSVSGCRIRFGTSARVVAGSMSSSICSRSENLIS